MSGLDDFGAFAAAPPPADVFASDDPFADIVHSASVAASSSAASGSGAAFQAPLLSFSPVATASSPPFADVFAPARTAPVEAPLLSFSPLLHTSGSSRAPSSLAAFALDSPAPISSSSSNGSGSASTRPHFALPPPRAATAPALNPTLASPPRATSFSGHVSLGELLSFSPVAAAGSFSDSFASSSAAGATGTSVFDDDELFSLSTVDMTLELPAAKEPADVFARADASGGVHTQAAAFPSPLAAFASPLSASGSEAANTPVGEQSTSADVFALTFPSPVATAAAVGLPSPVVGAGLSPAFDVGNEATSTLNSAPDANDGLERMTFSSSGISDSRSAWDEHDRDETTDTHATSDGVGGVAPTSLNWSGDAEDFGEAVDAASSGSSGGDGSEELAPVSGVRTTKAAEAFDTFDEIDEIDELDPAPAVLASSATLRSESEDDDDIGDFAADSFGGGGADDAFGDFTQTTTAEIGEFGDFAQSAATGGATADDDDNDFGDFGDFVQSSGGAVEGGDDDDFGDFGDFTQSSSGAATGDDDDDDDGFGAFSAPPSQAAAASSADSGFQTAAPPTELDLDAFFCQAFPVQSSPVPLEAAPFVPSASTRSSSKDLFHDKQGVSDSLITTIYRTAVESYFQDAPSSSTAAGARPTGVEQHRSELIALRLKHLKFVLTEKIQEAARHDGIFPHGSDRYHALVSLVNSDDEQQMRDALTSVQHALFNSSVNDAMMRFARQAAMSAKAKIAEQAAHQLSSSRGSLLATTRQLLSRGGGGGSSSSATPPGGHDSSDSGAGGAPTSGGYGGSGSVDDSSIEHPISGSESSGRRRHSGSSEADFAPSGSRGGSGSSGGGGLMKKFQDRFSSFSSSRGRTRVVSLRRMGQSGEDVRAMELNMDSISGGLDQVKWKCAVFLYDVDEVSKVAPSQIRILSYPSKEVLAAKSDRAALLKFLKPGAVWTIDIGASNNDVLNAW
ncbi:hypothetical protein PybrP1_007351 [[Pythium] brassicae (nom. inval.)]|nr:hypothetical protein PybrP1_007351 [[Pythium] brassicae (nom. inval.)]